MLDRRQFLDCFSSATSSGLPSQDVTDLAKIGITAQSTDPASVVLSHKQRQALARRFLDASPPPSLLALFPDAPPHVQDALESLSGEERIVVDANDARVTAKITDLSRIDKRHHLVVGTPGTGKTTALWRTAQRLLDRDDLVPIYVAIGGLSTWEDIVAALSQVAGDLTAAALMLDTRTCLCLDGWSEFAPGNTPVEKSKALRALQRVHVIATARAIDAADSWFRVWELGALPLQAVRNVLARATPGAPEPVHGVLDLLRLPLALSIYVLLGPQGSIGQLLAQLHRRFSEKTSAAFVRALPDAAATVTLARQRSFNRLVAELQASGIADAEGELRLLGTLTERHGNVQPIHDLYWSWLIGVGLLRSDLGGTALRDLWLRESYALALATDVKPNSESISTLPSKDIVLAADLVNNLSDVEREQIATLCDELLQASSLNMRYRAMLAILRGRIGRLLPKALRVLTEVIDAKLYRSEIRHAISPAFLYTERAAVADWLGSTATSMVLDSIAETGGPEWSSWLEQVQAGGKLDPLLAAAAALACTSHIPRWTETHLEALVRTSPWKLRATANRGANRTFAAWIADRYETLIDGLLSANPGSAGWIELNRVLVACGADAAFEGLKGRFSAMGAQAQKLLSFAVVERGGPWIPAFQTITKLEPGQRHHLEFMDLPLTSVDDGIARQWIADGHVVEGWRALLHNHGNGVLPEMLAALPASFGGHMDIPVLAAMRFLESPPDTLIPEMWSRLRGGTMYPKVVQDMIEAIARVDPGGVFALIRFAVDNFGGLAAYHKMQIIGLYRAWRARHDRDIRVRGADLDLPFDRWLLKRSAREGWDAQMMPRGFKYDSDLGTELALQEFAEDDAKAKAVLEHTEPFTHYDQALFERMVGIPTLVPLIPALFADAFDTFPEAQLQKFIACFTGGDSTLYWRLGHSSNPLHKSIHTALMAKILAAPRDIHNYRALANMLRSYPRHAVEDILAPPIFQKSDDALWFVREVEDARHERLLDEAGQWLR
jgi:hypothetical protein